MGEEFWTKCSQIPHDNDNGDDDDDDDDDYSKADK